MSRTEKTPAERRKGAVIMSALLIGFFALMVYSLQNKQSAEPWANWAKMRDGSGVVYRVDDDFVWYAKDYKNGHNVVAWISEDGFHAMAYWDADCVRGTEIETKLSYSDGSPITLECETGKSLRVGVLWNDGEPRRWKRDFGGFKVNTDFRDWDFTKGRQHLTLLKAKKIETATEG